MATSFKKRETVDPNHVEGIDIEGTDEYGNVVGKFRVKYMNPYANATLLATKRIDHRFQIKEVDDKNPDATFKAMRVRFVEMNLLGWSGVLDADDGEIPFSKEIAHEFFALEENRKVLMDLAIASKDATLFMADEPEAIVKN
jgi:hypothetical protein